MTSKDRREYEWCKHNLRVLNNRRVVTSEWESQRDFFVRRALAAAQRLGL